MCVIGNILKKASPKRAERLNKLIVALREDAGRRIPKLAREMGESQTTLYDDIKVLKQHYWFTLIPLENMGKWCVPGRESSRTVEVVSHEHK